MKQINILIAAILLSMCPFYAYAQKSQTKKRTKSAVNYVKKLNATNMENQALSCDLNDDGLQDKIVGQFDAHLGSQCVVMINSLFNGIYTTEIMLPFRYGQGTLYVMKNKTNGMHDIKATNKYNEVSYYVWSGQEYVQR